MVWNWSNKGSLYSEFFFVKSKPGCKDNRGQKFRSLLLLSGVAGILPIEANKKENKSLLKDFG